MKTAFARQLQQLDPAQLHALFVEVIGLAYEMRDAHEYDADAAAAIVATDTLGAIDTLVDLDDFDNPQPAAVVADSDWMTEAEAAWRDGVLGANPWRYER